MCVQVNRWHSSQMATLVLPRLCVSDYIIVLIQSLMSFLQEASSYNFEGETEMNSIRMIVSRRSGGLAIWQTKHFPCGVV